jgi:uncharacterized protein (DUF2062 family)
MRVDNQDRGTYGMMKIEIQYKSKRLADAMKAFLANGVSPEKLANAVAIGVMCGLFPIFGTTTIVSALAGLLFRVNPVVVQVMNYAMYPVYFFVQFGLIAAGAWIFEDGLDAYSRESIRAVFDAGWFSAFAQLTRALLHAVVVWALVSPLAGIGLRELILINVRHWQEHENA